MISEKERNHLEELFGLMRENPDLPLVPMVAGEIPADNYGFWLAEWGTASLEEYLISDERVIFKSDNDVFGTLESVLPEDVYEKLPEDESGCRKAYDELPWIKAIVVYIVEKI